MRGAHVLEQDRGGGERERERQDERQRETDSARETGRE